MTDGITFAEAFLQIEDATVSRMSGEYALALCFVGDVFHLVSGCHVAALRGETLVADGPGTDERPVAQVNVLPAETLDRSRYVGDKAL